MAPSSVEPSASPAARRPVAGAPSPAGQFTPWRVVVVPAAVRVPVSHGFYYDLLTLLLDNDKSLPVPSRVVDRGTQTDDLPTPCSPATCLCGRRRPSATHGKSFILVDTAPRLATPPTTGSRVWAILPQPLATAVPSDLETPFTISFTGTVGSGQPLTMCFQPQKTPHRGPPSDDAPSGGRRDLPGRSAPRR